MSMPNYKGSVPLTPTTQREKPHKGMIVLLSTMGDVCIGKRPTVRFINHPQFGDNVGYISAIVRCDCHMPRHLRDSYEIETENSRYTVVSPDMILE